MILLRLWAIALLVTPLLVAKELPDSAAIARNWRVTNVVEGPLQLADLRPTKLFHYPDEPIIGSVTMINRGDAAATVELRIWLERSLGTMAGEQRRTVHVPANEAHMLTFTWPATETVPWGQSMKAEVHHQGQLIARGEDVLCSAENVWRVGIAGGHPVAFTASHVRDLAGIERAVDTYRDNYVNTFEKFFWAPDDFADMTPEQEVWYSGQARYHENLERLKHMCAYGLQVGVLPTTYGKSIGSGTAARDFIRANPEMVYGFGGTMDFRPDTEELAIWQKDSEPYWQAIGWALYNMNDPAVVQHGIDEIIASSRQFGWAGVRFDGHFQARTGKQRVGDRTVDFSADDADRQTAANQRALKEQALKAFPRYVFGYNFANCVLDQRFLSNLRETIELSRDGGHIMDEYAKQNAGGNHPYRVWADYAELMVRQAEQVRRLGGELFPMVHGGETALGRYQAIFTYAAGAHPNNKTSPRNYNRFATRYGELLWHRDLEYVWNPLGLVVIQPGVMWENYVREVDLGKGRKRLIIHLINPPLQQTATETDRLEKELADRAKRRRAILVEASQKQVEPDYSELEALLPIQLEPAPQSNIAVRIVPQAMRGKWQASRALLLSADDFTAEELPIDRSDPYFWQLVVPELKHWSMIVLDLEVK